MNKIIDLIKDNNSFAIICHTKADADAIGASNALKYALLSLNKRADTFCADEVSEYLSFLNYENSFYIKPHKKYDVVMCLDCSNIDRIGSAKSIFYKNKITVNIDHHFDNENFAKINYVDNSSSSTSSIIYKLLCKIGVSLTPEIKNNLYSGIAGDTNCFLNSNTTSSDHEITAKLLKSKDFDFYNSNFNIFKRKTFLQFELLKTAFNNSKFYCDNKVVLTYITNENLIFHRLNSKDTGYIIQYFTGIVGTKIAIILTEQEENDYIISLRSEEIPCQPIAKFFGGGGHKFAAGCKVKGNLFEIIDKLVLLCKEEICKVDF